MAYTPTNWKTGDTVSSTRLNKLENAVSALADSADILEPAATSADVGKALIAKAVSGGKVTEYEFGEPGGGTNYVTLSGTTVTQTGVDNTMYLCGELTELTFTAPATGITAIRFTSGTTATVVTLTGVTMPDDWEGAEASTEYEINVLNGYGVYQKWAVSGS